MSKDTLAEYSNNHSGPRSNCGGDMTGRVKDIPYSPPVGPKNKTEVGRNGTNHGNCGTQGKR